MRRAVVKCALYASVLIAAGLFGFWLARSKDQHQEEHASACASGKPSYWYDPTFPDRHFDAPGKSSFMDMELVPKCPERNGSTIEGATPGLGPAGGIAVDARIVQSLGVRLAPVEQGTLARIVDTVGSVALDERRIEVVQVRAPGWVEVLDVRAPGDPVRRGQRLAAVYSPELLTAQQEFLIAISTGDADLIGAARQRLVLSGLPDAQIARVERSGQPERRVEYFAPFDGFVTDLGTRQGASVERATTLFQLADLSTVWINA